MVDVLVQLDHVEFSWPDQEKPILKIDQFAVQQHQHIFIRGDSGSGKTTLLNLLCGIHTAASGLVSVLGKDLGKLTQQQRDRFRGDHLGVIFQQFNLLPFLSVQENIFLSCNFSAKRLAKVDNLDQEVNRLLAALDLPPVISDKNMTELSVGQQQRVAACRALIGSPEIIIADEPTSALDAKNRNLFLDLLFKEADKHGSTIIFVSHDEHTAKQFPRIIELSDLNSNQSNDQAA